MKTFDPKPIMLAAVGLAIPALADRFARRFAATGYTAWTGERPPRNPAAIGVTWSQALVWTALAGALGGVARMATRKLLSDSSIPAEK